MMKPTAKAMSAREATASNLATLNALNRKLKRGYLKSSKTGKSSPTFGNEAHYDGRISEFTEKYMPWPIAPVEKAHPAPQYSPIPVSAESLDTSNWRSQAKVEQDQFERDRENLSIDTHSAGLRYGRDPSAPSFFAWNPETGRIPGYEAEDPTSPPGSVQREHAEHINDTTEYDQNYRWPPMDEVASVKRNPDTLSLFSVANSGNENGERGWQSEQHDRFAPTTDATVARNSGSNSPVAGVHSIAAPKSPIFFAWPQQPANVESARPVNPGAARDTEYARSYSAQSNMTPTRINRAKDTLSLFGDNGALGNQRAWLSEQHERYSPLQFDSRHLAGDTAGVHSSASDRPPTFFAWARLAESNDGPTELQEIGSCDAVVASNQCDGSTTTATVSHHCSEPTLQSKSVEIKPAGERITSKQTRVLSAANRPTPFSIDLILPQDWKSEYERSYSARNQPAVINSNDTLPRPPPPVPGVDFDCGASDFCDSLTNPTVLQQVQPPPPPLPTTIVIAPSIDIPNGNKAPIIPAPSRDDLFIPVQRDTNKSQSSLEAKATTSTKAFGSSTVANTFYDSLDAPKQSPRLRASYSEPTVSASLKSKSGLVTTTQSASGRGRTRRFKKCVAKPCYSLNARSLSAERASPISAFGSTNPRPNPTSNNDEYIAESHVQEVVDSTPEYIIVPTPVVANETQEITPNLSSELVTDHQKWQSQQKKTYSRYRAEHSQLIPDKVDSLLHGEVVNTEKKRYFSTETSENFEWPSFDKEMFDAARTEANLHQRHHDILLAGNADVNHGAKIDKQYRKSGQTEFSAQYSRPAVGKGNQISESTVFGKATGKHAPLWVAGASRPKEIEGCFRSQAPQNNVNETQSAVANSTTSSRRPKGAPAVNAVAAKKERDEIRNIASNVGWCPLNDSDSNAPVLGTVGSNTFATSTRADNDAASSITSVAPPTMNSSTVPARPGSADSNTITFKSVASATSDFSSGAKGSSGMTRGQVRRAPERSQINSNSSSHPVGCSCSKCSAKPEISKTYQGPASPSVMVPGRRVNLELQDSAVASRTAYIQGLREHCDNVARKRSNSAPCRRTRGFGEIAHSSGVHWYKPAFKADIATAANPILSHQRYPQASDKQIGRWTSESKSSFSWRGNSAGSSSPSGIRPNSAARRL